MVFKNSKHKQGVSKVAHISPKFLTLRQKCILTFQALLLSISSTVYLFCVHIDRSTCLFERLKFFQQNLEITNKLEKTVAGICINFPQNYDRIKPFPLSQINLSKILTNLAAMKCLFKLAERHLSWPKLLSKLKYRLNNFNITLNHFLVNCKQISFTYRKISNIIN